MSPEEKKRKGERRATDDEGMEKKTWKYEASLLVDKY